MGIQGVLTQTDRLDMRVVLVKQVLHELGLINGRSSGSSLNITKPRLGRKGKENTPRAILLVLRMGPFGFARTHGPYRVHVANEKARAFSET